jgi:hypothetical protein
MRFSERRSRKNGRNFQWVTKNQGLDIVEGSAPFETEKEIADGVGAGNVGALATRHSYAPTVGKEKLWMMVMHLDLLAPYQEAARDERP